MAVLFKNKGKLYASCGTIADAIGVSAAYVTRIKDKNNTPSIKHGRSVLLMLDGADEFSTILNNIKNYKIEELGEQIDLEKETENTKVSDLEGELADLQKRYANALKTISNKDVEIAAVKETLAKVRKEIENERSVVQNTKNSFNVVSNNVSNLQSELERTKNALAKEQKENEALAEKAKGIKTTLDLEIESLQLKLKAITILLDESKDLVTVTNKEKTSLLAEIETLKNSLLVVKTQVTKWDKSIAPFILKIVEGFTKIVDDIFTILKVSPALFAFFALALSIWEGIQQAKVINRPVVAILIQLTAVMVSIVISQRNHAVKNSNEKTNGILVGLFIYNFTMTTISFLWYSDLVTEWHSGYELFSQIGAYISFGVSGAFSFFVSSCIYLYTLLSSEKQKD